MSEVAARQYLRLLTTRKRQLRRKLRVYVAMWKTMAALSLLAQTAIAYISTAGYQQPLIASALAIFCMVLTVLDQVLKPAARAQDKKALWCETDSICIGMARALADRAPLEDLCVKAAGVLRDLAAEADDGYSSSANDASPVRRVSEPGNETV